MPIIKSKKTPVSEYASSLGEQASIWLNENENTAILSIRKVSYGDILIRVAKNEIIKVKPLLIDVIPGVDVIEKNKLLLLSWQEMNIIQEIRDMDYGDIIVNIANNNIMKINIGVTKRPTANKALELLKTVSKNKF